MKQLKDPFAVMVEFEDYFNSTVQIAQEGGVLQGIMKF
jgi:hypothetical protein